MVGIVSVNRLKTFERSVKESFSKVKDELTEHLDTINENTIELQSHQEQLTLLEQKIDKLTDKFDQLLYALEGKKKEQHTIETLTLREQEVFVCLYSLDDAQGLTYLDIGRRTGLPEEMIKSLVKSLISKGVPLIKRFIEDQLYIQLDVEFKLLQTKTNILELNEQIVKQMVQQDL
ncbi:MAG: sigma factor-like helix-turn-helix DNA-binding protein [Candidatus Woesearchaeota archaeon]